MIQNQRQYGVTKEQLSTLLDALEGAKEGKGKIDDQIYRSMIAGIESLADELRQDLRDYEGLQRAASLHVGRAEELPQALIKARIARGYTQEQLAERLGLAPQQIQRYEATQYRSASLKRLLAVMRALDFDFEADIPLRPAPGAAREEALVGEKAEPYRRKNDTHVDADAGNDGYAKANEKARWLIEAAASGERCSSPSASPSTPSWATTRSSSRRAARSTSKPTARRSATAA